MDFMGIGPLEILVILILGFLFLGPEKLPQVVAKAGRIYRNFKKATFDLSKSITEEIPTEHIMKNAQKAIVDELVSETKVENAEEATAEKPASDEKVNE